MQTHTKKRVETFFIFLLITVTAMFVECDVYFPDTIKIFDGETVDVREGSPYTVDIATSTAVEANGEYNAQVKLFGLIPIKDVEISVLPTTELVPGGKTVGIKLFTRGLMCVGTEKLTGVDGKTIDVEKEADFRHADMILRADGIPLHTVEQFGKIVAQSEGKPIKLTVERDGTEIEKTLSAIKTKEGYKLGIWVRDSTAGIGTVTFIDPKTKLYGALGHPITDVDTGALMPVEQGSISDAKIVNVVKGKPGEPGELCGLFDQSGTERGVIAKNTSRGIYGVLDDATTLGASGTPVPVASKAQVHTGKAEIYANVDGNSVEKYEVDIIRIMKHAADDKNMVVHVTDKKLLEKTGGIVQGMSGSPILQDGKIIGAVTHVFVNDPTKGYGIFIENMLAEAEK